MNFNLLQGPKTPQIQSGQKTRTYLNIRYKLKSKIHKKVIHFRPQKRPRLKIVRKLGLGNIRRKNLEWNLRNEMGTD
jgi:hypothetical protein